MKTWKELRMDMAEGFEKGGIFRGTLKAMGIIVLSIISLPVTLTKYLLLHEAKPYDYETKLNQRNDAEELKKHQRVGKNNQQEKDQQRMREQAEKDREVRPLKFDEQSKDAPVTNDKTRVKEAIDQLRKEETITNEKGKEVTRKTIAGVPYIGYSAKTGSMLFYSKDRNTIEVPIDSHTLKSPKTTNRIAEIFTAKAVQQYKEGFNTGLHVEAPVNPIQEENMKISSSIKATMLVGAINYSLDNIEKDTLSTVTVGNHTISLQIAENTQDENFQFKNYRINGDLNLAVNIIVDGEVKMAIGLSQLTDIKQEMVEDIAVQLDLNEAYQQIVPQSDSMSVPVQDVDSMEQGLDSMFDDFQDANISRVLYEDITNEPVQENELEDGSHEKPVDEPARDDPEPSGFDDYDYELE